MLEREKKEEKRLSSLKSFLIPKKKKGAELSNRLSRHEKERSEEVSELLKSDGETSINIRYYDGFMKRIRNLNKEELAEVCERILDVCEYSREVVESIRTTFTSKLYEYDFKEDAGRRETAIWPTSALFERGRDLTEILGHVFQERRRGGQKKE